MTIKELAQELGRSQQAVYKRLTRAGIDLKALREPGNGTLTAEGERIIRELYAASQETASESPPPAEKTDSTRLNSEVERLNAEVERLNNCLTEERHRAELAEAREEAAANERDFLRIQLDNAIKASALASVKRLQAPEDPSDPPPDPQPIDAEEAPQEAQEPQQATPAAAPRSFRQRWRDAINAWKGKE